MTRLQGVFQKNLLPGQEPKNPLRITKFARSNCLEITTLEKV